MNGARDQLRAGIVEEQESRRHTLSFLPLADDIRSGEHSRRSGGGWGGEIMSKKSGKPRKPVQYCTSAATHVARVHPIGSARFVV